MDALAWILKVKINQQYPLSSHWYYHQKYENQKACQRKRTFESLTEKKAPALWRVESTMGEAGRSQGSLGGIGLGLSHRICSKQNSIHLWNGLALFLHVAMVSRFRQGCSNSFSCASSWTNPSASKCKWRRSKSRSSLASSCLHLLHDLHLP